MKNIIYTLLLVAASLSISTAQTEKGRWTVGADVGGFSYQDQDVYKTFSANLIPSAGYFIANNLVIGTGVPLSLTKQAASGFISKYTGTGIGLSPFIRYYFGPASVKPYVGLSYNYTYINRQYITPTGDASGKGYSTAFAPTLGIAYFINRNIALNAGLNYNIETQETPALNFSGQPSRVPTIVTFKSENKLLSLNIGFQLFFGK